MARIGLYLYIVVLYQNRCECLLRKRNGPVKKTRRGLLCVVAVPAKGVRSGRYAILGGVYYVLGAPVDCAWC